MGRPERKLPAKDGPLTDFACRLRAARAAASGPSYRQLSAVTHFSPGTLARAASGLSLPSLDVTLAYAIACGADPGEWRTRWHAVAASLRSAAVTAAEQPQAEMTSLPASVWDFTGRRHALARLRGLLCTADALSRPVVSIVGPGGVGKSTLAVRAAHELAGEFPGGQVYLRARDANGDPVGASQLMYRVLIASGADSGQIPLDGEARSVIYHRMLHGRRVLLIFDDVQEIAQVKPLIPGDPRGAALVTSRVALDGMDSVELVRLGTFSRREALELLTRIVGPERVDAEPAAAAEILRACDMLPLAVRIAGTRLAGRPHWTLGDVATRLADERCRLDELSVADLGVRASLATGYQHLDSPTRRAFRLLGTLDVPELQTWIAAAALAVAQTEADQLLEYLVAAGFLEPGSGRGRFLFHDLVRLYARELSGQHDAHSSRAMALDRVLQASGSLVQAADRLLPGGLRGLAAPGPADLVLPAGLLGDPQQWLAGQEAGIVALIEQGCRSGPVALALRLSLGLVAFFELGSRYDSWHRVAEALHSAAAKDPAARSYALYLRGILASELGQPGTAVRLLTQAATQLGDLGEQRARGYAEVFLGNNYHGLGDLAGAIAAAQRALRAFQVLGDAQGIAYSRLVGGSALIASGAADLAVAELDLAAEGFRNLGHLQGEAHAVRALAHAQSRSGDHQVAAATFERARATLGPGASPTDQAILKLGLAGELNDQGSSGEALTLAAEAAEILGQVDNRFLQARASHMIARIELSTGSPDTAIGRLDQAAQIYGALDARLWEARALRDLGRAWLAAGEQTRARTVWERAKTMLTDPASPDAVELSELLGTLGRLRR